MRHILIASFLLAVSACSTSAPVVEPPAPPPPPSGPAFEAVYATDDGIVRHDFRADAVVSAASARGEVVAISHAPAGDRTVFAIADPDTTRLFVTADASADVRLVHQAATPTVYTVAWDSNSDAFAFGFYRPSQRDGRPAMGPGDIRLFDGTSVERVGCSASRAVLSWMDDDALLVRNTDNLYVVDADGCDTRATVDARRMVGLTVAPDAERMAFVHRELQYNRQRRAYEPDSTFRMTDLSGGNPQTVVSFRYSPRRFAWRPDGDELAFDVVAPDAGGVRAISIFDVASGRTAYLHPPGAVSEFDPRWSPSGDAILFRTGADGAVSLALRRFADQFTVSIPETVGAEPIGWVGNDAVAFRAPDGTTRIVGVDGAERLRLPAGASPIAVWPRN